MAVTDFAYGLSRVYQYNIGDIMRNLAYRIGESPKEVNEIFSVIHYPQLGEMIEAKGVTSDGYGDWSRTNYVDYRQYVAAHHEEILSHNIYLTPHPFTDEFREKNPNIIRIPSLKDVVDYANMHVKSNDQFDDDTNIGRLSSDFRADLIENKLGQIRSLDRYYGNKTKEVGVYRGTIRHISNGAYQMYGIDGYLGRYRNDSIMTLPLEDYRQERKQLRVTGVHDVIDNGFAEDLTEQTRNLIMGHEVRNTSRGGFAAGFEYDSDEHEDLRVTNKGRSVMGRTAYSYAENGSDRDIVEGQDGFKGVSVDKFNIYESQKGNAWGVDVASGTTLLSRTARSFKNNEYKTIVARFYNNDDENLYKTETQSNITRGYGLSHGRNLLKMEPTVENGYTNPYCRVWTYHHQYGQYKDTIRPFISTDYTGEILKEHYNWDAFRATGNGAEWHKTMDENTVLDNQTGLVRVTPYADETEDIQTSVKRCMFSIENLAWRDVKNKNYYLSRDQIGPFGGRIMWFPPYDLRFNESASVNWHGADFIGRGEKIYTYVNTERSGQLSFKLLIDHPSIINHADLESVSLPQGAEGEDAQEQALLRFFAGCEILSARSRKKPLKYQLVCRDRERTIVKDETEKIYFMVFYPNNYSGEEAGDLKGNITFPIQYLIEGVGTQMGYNITYNTKDFLSIPGITNDSESGPVLIPFRHDPAPSAVGPHGMPFKKISTNEYGALTIVEPTASKFVTPGHTAIGGYEMTTADTGNIYGISGIKYSATEDISGMPYVGYSYKTVTGSTVLQLGQNYMDNNGNFQYDGEYHKDPELLIGDVTGTIPQSFGIVSYGDERMEQYVLTYIQSGQDKRPFYYRVDDKYVGPKATTMSEKVEIRNSVDQRSIGINLSRDVLYDNFTHEMNVLGVTDKEKLFSLFDMACYVQPVIFKPDEGVTVHTDKLTALFDKYKVMDVKAIGFATSSGHGTRNTELSDRRATTAKRWIVSALKQKGVEFDDEPSIQDNMSTVWPVDDIMNINSNESKFYRSAFVTIELAPKVVTTEVVTETNEGFDNYKVGDIMEFSEDEIDLAQEIAARNNCEWVLQADGTDYDAEEIGTYGSEYMFFQRLTSGDSLVRSMIVDKIKYFDPAYHSISPEGFNARLNFLHQCTRQGPTNGNTIENTSNLSFGRPPVCILRIGDFYYTKILINSLNITYDETTWDLNQEGAGVQPMIANVNIDFTFIGGSDMTGPISRLQNAVSSNYYANASIYDKNAEQGTYEPGTPRMTSIRANGIDLNTSN